MCILFIVSQAFKKFKSRGVKYDHHFFFLFLVSSSQYESTAEDGHLCICRNTYLVLTELVLVWCFEKCSQGLAKFYMLDIFRCLLCAIKWFSGTNYKKIPNIKQWILGFVCSTIYSFFCCLYVVTPKSQIQSC